MIDDMNDDDIELPTDAQFDAWIEKVAPSLNAPPATPRLEMWDKIATAQAKNVPGVLRFRRARSADRFPGRPAREGNRGGRASGDVSDGLDVRARTPNASG